MFHGAYTWAAWFWRALVREWRLLKPEEAVHRLTGMPAKILGLSDRGAIRVGARADIAVFSENEFGERGTMFEPNQLAHGMHHVVVNGVATLSNGVTDRRARRTGLAQALVLGMGDGRRPLRRKQKGEHHDEARKN